MTADIARFRALGTNAVVLAPGAGRLDAAVVAAAGHEIDAIDSPARGSGPTPSWSALNTSAGRPSQVSALLLRRSRSPLRAAALTDGWVDPTIGGTLRAARLRP